MGEPRTLYGGGCSEMVMAKAVDELAAVTPGKESRAMESFANALRQLPSIIAENGGYDSAQLVSELKAQHILGKNTLVGHSTAGSSLLVFHHCVPPALNTSITGSFYSLHLHPPS